MEVTWTRDPQWLRWSSLWYKDQKTFEMWDLNCIATFVGGFIRPSLEQASPIVQCFNTHAITCCSLTRWLRAKSHTHTQESVPTLNVQHQRRYDCNTTHCRQQFSSFNESEIKVFIAPSQLPAALKCLQKWGMRNTGNYLICLFPLLGTLFLIFQKGTRSKNGEIMLASSNTSRIPIKPDENQQKIIITCFCVWREMLSFCLLCTGVWLRGGCTVGVEQRLTRLLPVGQPRLWFCHDCEHLDVWTSIRWGCTGEF